MFRTKKGLVSLNKDEKQQEKKSAQAPIMQSYAPLMNSRQPSKAATVDWGKKLRDEFLQELPEGANGRTYYLGLEGRLKEEKVLLLEAVHTMIISKHTDETTNDKNLKQKIQEDRALFISTLMQKTQQELLQTVATIKSSYQEAQKSLAAEPALAKAYELMMSGDVNDLNQKFKSAMKEFAVKYTKAEEQPTAARVSQNENIMLGMLVMCCLGLGADLTFRRVMSRISEENMALFKQVAAGEVVCFAASHAQIDCIKTLHQMGFDLNRRAPKDAPFNTPLQAASNALCLFDVFQLNGIEAYNKTVDTLLQLGADPNAGGSFAVKHAQTLIDKAKKDEMLSPADKEKICAALQKVADARENTSRLEVPGP